MIEVKSGVIKFYWPQTDLLRDIYERSSLNAKYFAEAEIANSLILSDDEKLFVEEQMPGILSYLASKFQRITPLNQDLIIPDGNSVTDYGFVFVDRNGQYGASELNILHNHCEEWLKVEVLRKWYSMNVSAELLRSDYTTRAIAVESHIDEAIFQFYKPVHQADSLRILNVKIDETEYRDCAVQMADMDCSDPVEGSQLLMRFGMTPIDGVHLSNCDFVVQYYTQTLEKCHSIAKEEMMKQNDDEYLALVDTGITGAGTLKYLATIEIPYPSADSSEKIKQIKDVTTSQNIRPMPK